MSLKATDKPEISKKWWTSEKPDNIKGQDLEKALAGAEKALADADKNGSDAKTLDAALAALKSLGDAVEKTIKKECDKKKDKDLITVLEKYDGLIEDETGQLEEAKAALDAAKGEDGEEEETEDDKGVFKEEYLARMIKQLRGGAPLSFSFGLNKSEPENSRLVLCNKREPKKLKAMMKRRNEFKSQLLTFGTALGDGKVIEFSLSEDSKEPAAIIKVAKVFLKKNPELKFKKIRVISGGQTLEEDMDDAGQNEPQVAAGAAGGDLQQKLKSAATAAQTWKQARETVTDQIAQLRRELDAFDDPDVQSVRDRLSTVLERYPNLDFSALAGAADQAAYDSSLAKTRQGVADWVRTLQADAALREIDKNPFGVQTNVVDTLGQTLGTISRELKLT